MPRLIRRKNIFIVLLAAFVISSGGVAIYLFRHVEPQVRIGKALWRVEVADNPGLQYRGLAGRQHLAENRGMLFVYPSGRILDFCMRGCDIPLDIAFIDSNMRIVKIHTMAVEADRAGRKVYSSILPARYALEVPAGAFGRSGTHEGQQVRIIGLDSDATKAPHMP